MTPNETLKVKRKQAIKLVDEIQGKVKSINEIHEFIDSLSKQLKIKDKDYSYKIEKLNTINASLGQSITKFEEDKIKISKYLKDAEEFYKKRYLPLIEKINDPVNGFKVKVKNSESIQNELNRISTYCISKYTDIKTITIDYRKQIGQLNKIIKRIEGLEVRSTNTRTKIEVIQKNISDLEKKAFATLKTIQDDKNESNKTLLLIENAKIESDNVLSKIAENHLTSEEKLIGIQKIYEIAHETGLSGEFEKRRNQHNSERIKWGKYVFITAIVLLVLLISFYTFQLALYKFDLESVTFDINFYIRYVILSPVVYYLYFCASQHNKERRLFDKYSFKTTIAMSIKSHIELLLNQSRFESKENTERIINFVLDGFRNIYNEPYDIDDYRMKLKLSDIELDLEKRLIDKLGINKIIPKK